MNDDLLVAFLIGAIAAASGVAGLLFLRSYRRTHDRFFLYFAASFWIESAGRFCSGFWHYVEDDDALLYALRVIAYGLILIAVLEKNLPRRERP